jgi:hypothetical protein
MNIRSSRGQTGLGVLLGVLATLAVLALAAAVAWVAMGRCPMCGGMMRGKSLPSDPQSSVHAELPELRAANVALR